MDKSRQAVSQKKAPEPNRLINEASPYLLQHAHNPVDWFPWGDEAFAKARQENKPLFVSIGYSTCHWCHVMEQESFEDPEIAELFNSSFVCIKVDREERPDLDNTYMTIAQMLTGQGGWPLNIFMTPDKKPFFAATYIPREARFGMTGLKELLPQVAGLWKSDPDRLLEDAEKISQYLKHKPEEKGRTPVMDLGTLHLGFTQLAGNFDSEHGGFGYRPKFPTPHNFYFLLRWWRRIKDPQSLLMVEKSLAAMRLGGIFDQVGFGFHRYATDPAWTVPHFEKMLYDQALLAGAYTEAFLATGKDSYRATAREIFEYVLRDMTSPEGAFYSAEDADSEGEEGRFYLWTVEEIRTALPVHLAGPVIKMFELSPRGNLPEGAFEPADGKNILFFKRPLADLAEEMSMSERELRKIWDEARVLLFKTRERRVHPAKDDKVLADWNGLMIAALAKAAQAFDLPEYYNAAARAADFVLAKMTAPDGSLYHRERNGNLAVPGFLDDHAFLVHGLIELYEAGFETRWLKKAVALLKLMIRDFWDVSQGGFFMTARNTEPALARAKEIYDGAMPSGNSLALLDLLRIGRMLADSYYEDLASQMVKTFSRQVASSPASHAMFLAALDFALGPYYQVVIAGDLHARDSQDMLKAIRSNFVPQKIMHFLPVGNASTEILDLVWSLKPLVTKATAATAYVCQNFGCDTPTTDIKQVLKNLGV